MLLTILFVSISIIFLSVYLIVSKVSTKNKSKKLNLNTYLWSSIIQSRKKLSNESSSR